MYVMALVTSQTLLVASNGTNSKWIVELEELRPCLNKAFAYRQKVRPVTTLVMIDVPNEIRSYTLEY